MKKAYLILQNGQAFPAFRFGAEGEITAELVFTTAMVGYLETLTDPSYHGEIVLQTFPLIGNYGVIPADFESRAPKLSAYIVRDVCDLPSNFRSEGRLNDYLNAQNIIGLYGLDTRELTKIIREYGVMNASISDTLPEDMTQFCENLAKQSLSSRVEAVTCEELFEIPADEGVACKKHVVLWDFGFKGNIARELTKRGCKLTVVPAHTTADAILALQPDGILLSNGPGDPAKNTEIIKTIGEVMASAVPTMGICLGHQLLALAKGATSVKLKYGHRGANQPVRDMKTDRLYITSQNHGYTIDHETLPETARLSFANLNDGTCEGIDYLDIPAFTVQFHPEACGGPRDTNFLFDRFITMMEEVKACH